MEDQATDFRVVGNPKLRSDQTVYHRGSLYSQAWTIRRFSSGPRPS